MKIITVVGKDKSWKTTLITEVYEEVLRKGTLDYYKQEGEDNRDFKALISYGKNKKIAFCSIGDPSDSKHLPSEYILRGLVFASKQKADILINAYSESFDVYNNTTEFSYETYKAIVETKENKYVPIIMNKDGNLEKQKKENYETILKELNLI